MKKLIAGALLLLMAACGGKGGGQGEGTLVEGEKREEFAQFFEQFKTDSAFQKSRIVFPLVCETNIAGEERPDLIEINEQEWGYTSFHWEESYATRETDAYTQEIEVKKDSAFIRYIGVENCINTHLIFTCQGGKWYYSRLVDYSN